MQLISDSPLTSRRISDIIILTKQPIRELVGGPQRLLILGAAGDRVVQRPPRGSAGYAKGPVVEIGDFDIGPSVSQWAG
jgi:hypothetical protein